MNPNPGGRDWSGAYRVVAAAFLAAVAVPCLLRQPGDWEKVYVESARRLQTGGDVYEWGVRDYGYVYPPFGAVAAVPFSRLPDGAGRVAWAAVNVAAAFVFLRGAWRLAGGTGTPRGPADHTAFWLGAATAGGFALDAVANRQVDLVVAALLVTGCERVTRGRPVGGVLFGVAAALKCTPLLFAPYLAWRGKWAGAAAVAGTFLAVNLLPDALYPPDGGRPRLVQWGERFLAPISSPGFDPGVWASEIGFNHSVAGVANRWLTTGRAVMYGQTVSLPRADRPSTAALKGVVYAVAAGFLLAAVLAAWRRPAEPGGGDAAEYGMVLALMLLLSPMSSKPHFCTLLVPQLVVARAALAGRDRFLLGIAVLSAAGGLAGNKDLVGKAVYEWLLWHGCVFGNSLILFLGCAYARWRASCEAVSGQAACGFTTDNILSTRLPVTSRPAAAPVTSTRGTPSGRGSGRG